MGKPSGKEDQENTGKPKERLFFKHRPSELLYITENGFTDFKKLSSPV